MLCEAGQDSKTFEQSHTTDFAKAGFQIVIKVRTIWQHFKNRGISKNSQLQTNFTGSYENNSTKQPQDERVWANLGTFITLKTSTEFQTAWPVPPSRVIAILIHLTFAPASTLKRLACGKTAWIVIKIEGNRPNSGQNSELVFTQNNLVAEQLENLLLETLIVNWKMCSFQTTRRVFSFVQFNGSLVSNDCTSLGHQAFSLKLSISNQGWNDQSNKQRHSRLVEINKTPGPGGNYGESD